MTTPAEPITANLYLGGMRGPEGTISRESFDRRKHIQLNVFIQEDHLADYAADPTLTDGLGDDLAGVLQRAIQKYFALNPDAFWTSNLPRPPETMPPATQ